MPDKYLKLLNLRPGASLNDVKKAYRQLAKENHPDLFTEENRKKKQEKIMVGLNEAYHAILDNFKDSNTSHWDNPDDKTRNKSAEDDYSIYKTGVAYFNKYTGSITLKFKNNKLETETLKEKICNIENARAYFTRVLQEYPDSDWAFDSEEKLKKIEKILTMTAKTIFEAEENTLAYTKKGTPYWKKKSLSNKNI